MHATKMLDTKSTIFLNNEFNEDISPSSGTDRGTYCYVIIISKCMLRYESDKNRIEPVY